MPTIRIDDQVYAWLKSQAVPFDDTPNSVLRRIAELDKPGVGSAASTCDASDRSLGEKGSSRRRKPLITGDRLKQRWKLPVLQARFHRDGTWYEVPDRFPAALCDCDGYIIFETEDEFRSRPGIKVGKQVNVDGGISSLAGYLRAADPVD